MESEDKIKTKLCIWCKSEIPKGASICVHCNSYQKKWKSEAKFLTGIARLLTIVAGVVVFIVTNFPEFRKIVDWNDEVKVISFVNNQEVIISNVGDGDLFIEYIQFVLPMNDSSSATETIRIQEMVKQGTVLKHTLNDGSKFSGGSFVKGGNTPTTQKRVEIANRAIGDNDCFALDIRDINDVAYKQVKAYYEREFESGVMTLPCQAKLFFYSFTKKKIIESTFEVVAMVVRNPTEFCALELLEIMDKPIEKDTIN